MRAVREVPAEQRGTLYVGNRGPLAASPLMKLPIGSIKPGGWLRRQLELEKDGMVGQLAAISPWLDRKTSAWGSEAGTGERGWEELPYWLKGYGDLGYVLGDQHVIAAARAWIEAVLASQRDDGWFGPRALLTGLDGQPDLWPHMVMLDVLQSYHEFTGDARVLDVMKRYFAWQHRLPATAFGAGYWPRLRAGDNLESAYWLYNRTGEPWLLDLARKIHENMARWSDGVVDWHNVNIAQGFRAPAVYSMQAHDPVLLAAAERNYREVMDRYGQFPGGTFAGDENCRPGFADPRQGFETCGIVEFMHSFEMLTRISGQSTWADRCEDLAFNSLPAAMTPDLKALHYLTCANQVQLDAHDKAPGIDNRGTMFAYSPFEVYRCCQHNVAHGWPYFAEELWLATADHGLCASLYAACDVTARVASGTSITIVETTDYPFDEVVTLALEPTAPVTCPLYLRVPRWCRAPALQLNGADLRLPAEPLSYLVITREWHAGDRLTLRLPAALAVRRWPHNQDAASIDYGPLTFSIAIDERWQRYGRQGGWAEWEVLPASPWNYGLLLDEHDPTSSLTLTRAPGPLAAQPFTPASVPLRVTARARRIPAWQLDARDLLMPLQPSPVRSDQRDETIALLPMGAARLRITMMPVIGDGPGAHDWTPPPRPRPPLYRASASHVGPDDTIDALCDGLEPSSSSDQRIPRFTWWDHRGTREWVQCEFDRPRQLTTVAVYWFDDTGSGACRVPRAWHLSYRASDAWRPVPGAPAYRTQPDEFNVVSFAPIETTALRIDVELQPGASSGILEWRVE
ncbi:MAG: glycoside hydrolase family 127 protein [Planctomycetota bacterium]